MPRRSISLLVFCVFVVISTREAAAENTLRSDSNEAPVQATADGAASPRAITAPLEISETPGVPATDTNVKTEVTKSSSPIPLSSEKLRWLTRRLIAGLAGVAVLSIVIAFASKLQTNNLRPDQDSPLQLVSTIRIAPRCCVTLVNANGQAFLVTRDASGVKHIVPVPRSFDSYVMDDLGETNMPLPESDRQPN